MFQRRVDRVCEAHAVRCLSNACLAAGTVGLADSTHPTLNDYVVLIRPGRWPRQLARIRGGERQLLQTFERRDDVGLLHFSPAVELVLVVDDSCQAVYSY